MSLVYLMKKVLESSREIGRSSGIIAKGSETQVLIVQKTSIKVENSVKSMDSLMRRSNQTMSKINEAMKKTQAGENNARETLKRLEDVLQEMSRYSDPIAQLARKVEKIKVIVNVLDSIAQKTDLLSLNASIEATRAGETGKGFALVADEIRSMADSSKQSSQEISKLVEDILADNKAVIGFMAKNQTDINKGNEILNGIVVIFAEMLTNVREIFSEVKQVEDATAEQVDHMRGLAENFTELARLANENFIATQNTSEAIERQKKNVNRIAGAVKGLNSLSNKMVETQQRFRLPEQTA
jgi:methyl-accepting chemotaxis protein